MLRIAAAAIREIVPFSAVTCPFIVLQLELTLHDLGL